MGFKKIINKTTLLYTLYAVIVTLFFVWYLFPSEYFAQYIERSIASYGKDVSVEIEGANPSLPTGVKLTGLKVTTPLVSSVPVDYIKVRVGVFSLIKFDPVIYFSAGIFGGTIKGSVKIPKSDTRNLSVDDISIKGIDTALCARFVEAYIPGYTITGTIDADGSYEAKGRQRTGTINVRIKQLSVKPEKPFLTLASLSFNEITAQIQVKNKRIHIEECDIDGNEFDGSVKGSVIVKAPVDRSVLRLTGKFKPEKEFAEKMPLQLVFKKKVKYGDELPFKILGTIKKPRLR